MSGQAIALDQKDRHAASIRGERYATEPEQARWRTRPGFRLDRAPEVMVPWHSARRGVPRLAIASTQAVSGTERVHAAASG